MCKTVLTIRSTNVLTDILEFRVFFHKMIQLVDYYDSILLILNMKCIQFHIPIHFRQLHFEICLMAKRDENLELKQKKRTNFCSHIKQYANKTKQKERT